MGRDMGPILAEKERLMGVNQHLEIELASQKAIAEQTAKALEECLVGGNSLASVLIGYNLPQNWQDWSIEKASTNFYTLYPVNPDMAYERYEIWLCWKTLHNHNETLDALKAGV